MARCITGCGSRAVHDHHVIYRQELKRRGGDPRAAANLVPVCFRCHERHHTASLRIPMKVLPDSVFEFARDLMGPGAAFEYLTRHYEGADRRLGALLEDA